MTVSQNKTKRAYQLQKGDLNEQNILLREIGQRLDALEGIGQKTVKTGETVYTTEVVRIQSQLDMDGNPINNVGEPEEDADAATKEWVLEKIATETPGEHSETHESGGDDEIKLDDLGAPDDTTDLDATAAKHGLMSKTYASKLDGIETAADVTDAENIEDAITGADEESDPEDADLFTTIVSSVLKKITWANIKATLKTYFDTLYSGITHASNHTDGTDDIQDATAAQKGLATAAQITKLDGIEAAADVTDATNVDGAGATMNTDTDVKSNSWVIDEDNMASDLDTKVPTQQSVKAYADAIAAAGGNPGEGHILIFPRFYSAITQGTWTAVITAIWLYAMYYNSSGNQNDQIDYKVYLAAGTYTFALLYSRSTDRGKLHLLIDAADQGSIDLYGTLAHNSYGEITGIVIATSGLKTVSFKVSDKNASSSDYLMPTQIAGFYRTA